MGEGEEEGVGGEGGVVFGAPSDVGRIFLLREILEDVDELVAGHPEGVDHVVEPEGSERGHAGAELALVGLAEAERVREGHHPFRWVRAEDDLERNHELLAAHHAGLAANVREVCAAPREGQDGVEQAPRRVGHELEERREIERLAPVQHRVQRPQPLPERRRGQRLPILRERHACHLSRFVPLDHQLRVRVHPHVVGESVRERLDDEQPLVPDSQRRQHQRGA